jgi:spermidine synthase
VCFAVTFLVGTLTGIELPLLIDIGNAVVPGREVTNRVLGWDYIGALGGGVVFPLFLVPNFELHTIGFAVAVVNLAVALFIAVRVLPGEPNHAGRLAGGIAFTVLLVAGMLNGATIEQFILKKYYFYFETAGEGPGSLFDPLSRMPDVRRSSSPYQKIDMVHYPTPWDPITEAYSSKFVEDPDRPRDRYLFLNGDRQLGSNFEELYHEWFAHVPIIATGAVPRRVLIMGGGDGILHRELFKYDEVESVTHVDIDFRLVAMAKHDSILTAINEHALDDPRNHTIFADAYKWIREYDGPPFDAVYLDFPVARDYNLSRLFTREFYTFVATHLVEHGFLVMDAPRLWLWTNDYRSGTMETYPAGTWDIHSNTLRSAGFHTVVPFYSNLEADNPAARRALASSNKLRRAIAESNGALASAEAQQQWIEDYLGRMWRLRMGFLYARKDRRNGPFEYHDFGIKLHLLNEKRFDLALPVHVEFEHDIDMSKVNSIMRPRLPRGDLTDIRASW